jgi:integrase/recombinase XerD
MSRVSKMQLPFEEWPGDDRQRWEAAFRLGDLFDDDNRGSHLAESTRNALRVSYAQYLRFISENNKELFSRPPDARINRKLVAEYVTRLRNANGDSTIVISLHHLRLALRLICPEVDWSWLLTITKRIAAAAPRRARKYGLVTIEQLYLLGIELMDNAVADAREKGKISKAAAMQYRDGLLIVLISVLPVRRRTVTAMRISKQLVRAGDLWALDIPPEDTKGKRALDYPIAADLSRRIDVYLQKFRVRFPGAEYP